MNSVDANRTLHYKVASLYQAGEVDLQALIEQALATRLDVESREETVVLGGNRKRVLSGAGQTNGMFRAKLMQYTPGQKQQFLEKDDTTKDYKLDSISPPANATSSVRREFVESLLYLAVFKNHVMFIGSQALKSKALEDHLNWLLRSTGKLVAEDFLLLKDQQSAEALKDLSKKSVNKVCIGSDLQFEAVHTQPTKRRTKSTEKVEGFRLLKPVGDTAEALRVLLGDWFADAELKSALRRNEHIEFKLELIYKNRKKSEEGFELMEKLAVAARHFDPEDCSVFLHRGGELKGDELKIQVPFRVAMNESGLLEEPDTWVRMHTWLRDAISKKTVPG